jgi:TrmH family RNA methyltransferase
VKEVRKLIKSAKARAEARAFCVEGEKLIGEALQAGFKLERLYFAGPPPAFDVCIEMVEVSQEVMESIASTVSPQGSLAVFSMGPIASAHVQISEKGEAFTRRELDEFPVIPELDSGSTPITPVLVDINDPGNLGAIARSCEAAGVTEIVTIGGSTDRFNPKVIRASAGSMFRMRFNHMESLEEVVDLARNLGRNVYGTGVVGGSSAVSYQEQNLAGAFIVFGSEAHGLSQDQLAACDSTIHIPMAGQVESLNLAVSVALVAFKANSES